MRTTVRTAAVALGAAALGAGIAAALPDPPSAPPARVAPIAATSTVTLVATPNPADFVGVAWRLTRVTAGTRTTDVPTSWRTRLELSRDGRISVDDGLNAQGGHYMLTADGFTVDGDVISTLVGYAGDDEQALAALNAFQVLLHGEPTTAGGTAGGRNQVLSASPSDLVLRSGRLRLTFVPA